PSGVHSTTCAGRARAVLAELSNCGSPRRAGDAQHGDGSPLRDGRSYPTRRHALPSRAALFRHGRAAAEHRAALPSDLSTANASGPQSSPAGPSTGGAQCDRRRGATVNKAGGTLTLDAVLACVSQSLGLQLTGQPTTVKRRRMTTHQGIEPSTNQVTDYYDRVAESWDAKEGSERYNPYFACQLRDHLKTLLADSAGKPPALELGAATGPYVAVTAPLFGKLIAADLTSRILALLERLIAPL